jgi:hypothetical protein
MAPQVAGGVGRETVYTKNYIAWHVVTEREKLRRHRKRRIKKMGPKKGGEERERVAASMCLPLPFLPKKQTNKQNTRRRSAYGRQDYSMKRKEGKMSRRG